MKVIYKYPVLIGEFEHGLPKGAKILSVQLQDEQPYFWALIDPESPREIREFRVFGTGHEIDDEWHKYHATFQQGPFVWHLFEKGES